MSSVPKIIHTIWYQGSDAIPEKYLVNLRKFRMLNPGWEIRVWDNASLRAECSVLGPEYLEAYDSFKIMHQRIDFGRYVVLSRYGGISVDMDVVALRPFDELDFLADLRVLAVSRSVPVGRFSAFKYQNAVLVTPPGDPMTRWIVDQTASTAKTNSSVLGRLPDSAQVMLTTGPWSFSRIIDRGPAGGVLALDHTVFEPCLGYDTKCKAPKSAFLFHQHDGTWHGFGKAITILYDVGPDRIFVALVSVVVVAMMVGRLRK